MPDDRDEHLAWCKRRARYYLECGELGNALASMGSDLSKHPDLKGIGEKMMPLGLLHAMQNDADGMRRWIDGFR